MEYTRYLYNWVLMALFLSAQPYHDSPRDYAGATVAIPTSFKQQYIETIDGQKLSLYELLTTLESPKVIEFWASWCGACKRNMPDLATLQSKTNKKAPVSILISTDRNRSAWLSAVSKLDQPATHYRILGGWNHAAYQLLEVKSIPRYMLVSEDRSILNLRLTDPLNPSVIDVLNQEGAYTTN